MPVDTLNSALWAVHDHSLPAIGLLQQSFPNGHAFMINISVFFDPRYVFLVYAPILFALNKRVGHRMIVALTCCEWLNQVLKWLLAGDRPYWYVHEYLSKLPETTGHHEPNHHHHQHKQPLPVPEYLKFKQFPVTCELGAGSPSGHAMVTATVWYVLIDAYLKGELKLFAKNGRRKIPAAVTGPEVEAQSSWLADNRQRIEAALAQLSWSAYAIILVLVGLSRVYLACHFPHQCLCGAILGCLLAKLVVERLPMGELRRWHFAAATLAMFVSVMATYGLLRARGFDPLWSVGKAMRWCERPEHIHLDTTPFYSMMRYLGFCLGAGLAYDATTNQASHELALFEAELERSRGHSRLGKLVLLIVRRALVVCLSIGFGQLLLAIPLSRTHLNLYYAISFLLYTIFAYSFAKLIPDLVKSVLPISVNFNVQRTTANASLIGENGAPLSTRKKKISIKKLH